MKSVLRHPLVRKAASFAKEKHKHQKRLTGEPYFVHPKSVAASVAKWTSDPNVVAAAYLHDVIEDTGCDYEDLETRFGRKVADYVSMLSRDFRRPKKLSLIEFRKTLRKAPPEVKLIEAADIEHNLRSKASPDFMRRYVEKTRATLPYLKDGRPRKYQEGINWFIEKIEFHIKSFKR